MIRTIATLLALTAGYFALGIFHVQYCSNSDRASPWTTVPVIRTANIGAQLLAASCTPEVPGPKPVSYCDQTGLRGYPPTRSSALSLCTECVRRGFPLDTEIPREEIRNIYNKRDQPEPSFMYPDLVPEFQERLWGKTLGKTWICFASYRADKGWEVNATEIVVRAVMEDN